MSNAGNRTVESLKQAIAHAKGEIVNGRAQESAFYFQDGRLMLRASGKCFPAAGGVECGSWTTFTDVSQHIGGLIRNVLNDIKSG